MLNNNPDECYKSVFDGIDSVLLFILVLTNMVSKNQPDGMHFGTLGQFFTGKVQNGGRVKRSLIQNK